jgi:hypothetical protein
MVQAGRAADDTRSSRPRPNSRLFLAEDQASPRATCVARTREPDGRFTRAPRVLGAGAHAECGFDATGERVDQLGELGHCLEGAVFAPPGDVGHGLARHVEPEAAEHDERRRVDDNLRSRARVLLVVDPERVDRLVDQRTQPRVRRELGIDRDGLALGVARRPRGRVWARTRPCSRATRRTRSRAGSGGRGSRRSAAGSARREASALRRAEPRPARRRRPRRP